VPGKSAESCSSPPRRSLKKPFMPPRRARSASARSRYPAREPPIWIDQGCKDSTGPAEIEPEVAAVAGGWQPIYAVGLDSKGSSRRAAGGTVLYHVPTGSSSISPPTEARRAHPRGPRGSPTATDPSSRSAPTESLSRRAATARSASGRRISPRRSPRSSSPPTRRRSR
jgi:hypothetical protein